MTSFGEYLKILRERVGISQEGLAQEANISSAYVSQIESGRRNVPTPDVLRRMAAPLDVPYLVLMKQAGHLHESELQMLLLRTIKVLFAQEPGRTRLEEVLRDSIDRWIELDAQMRDDVLNRSDVDHVGELIIDALLQRQADLILADLFSDNDRYGSISNK